MARQMAGHQGSYISEAPPSDYNAACTHGEGQKKSQAQLEQGKTKPHVPHEETACSVSIIKHML